MKRCRVCGESHPETNFHRDRRARDGLRNICKKCASDSYKKHYAANTAKIRENSQKYDMLHPLESNVRAAVGRARRAGLAVDKELLLSLARTVTRCPVFGTLIEFGRGQGYRPPEHVASFDQIIPGRGYVAGNVRMLSWLANKMLSNATQEQRIALARWILKDQGALSE